MKLNIKKQIRNKSLSFLILLIPLLSQCNKATKKTDSSDLKNINVSVASLKETITKEELIDTLWNVRLESDGNNLISKCDKVVSHKDYLYILDWGQQKVFAFSMNGKYLGNIGRRGRGPNEYLHIEEIYVTPYDQVVLYDAPDHKLFYYTLSGDFVKIEEEPLSFVNMRELPNGSKIYYTDKKYNEQEKIRNTHITIRTKSDNILVFLPNKAEIEVKMRSPDTYLFNSNDAFFFHLPFRNSIYQIQKVKIQNNRLVEKYRITFNRKGIPENVFTSTIDENKFLNDYARSNNYISIIGSVQATESHIIIPLFCNLKLAGNIWISRISGKAIATGKILIDENTYLPGLTRSTRGDTIICIKDAYYSMSTGIDLNLKDNENPEVTFYVLKKF